MKSTKLLILALITVTIRQVSGEAPPPPAVPPPPLVPVDYSDGWEYYDYYSGGWEYYSGGEYEYSGAVPKLQNPAAGARQPPPALRLHL